jgi:hypothetical protein
MPEKCTTFVEPRWTPLVISNARDGRYSFGENTLIAERRRVSGDTDREQNPRHLLVFRPAPRVCATALGSDRLRGLAGKSDYTPGSCRRGWRVLLDHAVSRQSAA